MTKPPPDEDVLVCFCMGVPLDELRAAIAAGAHTIDDLSERTGAGTGCGTCRIDLFELLVQTGALDPDRPDAPNPDDAGPNDTNPDDRAPD